MAKKKIGVTAMQGVSAHLVRIDKTGKQWDDTVVIDIGPGLNVYHTDYGDGTYNQQYTDYGDGAYNQQYTDYGDGGGYQDYTEYGNETYYEEAPAYDGGGDYAAEGNGDGM